MKLHVSTSDLYESNVREDLAVCGASGNTFQPWVFKLFRAQHQCKRCLKALKAFKGDVPEPWAWVRGDGE